MSNKITICLPFISLLVCINLYSQEDPFPVPPPPPQVPTNVNIAEPKNVLVVFRQGNQVSKDVANYYVQARNIPSINIVKDDFGNPGLFIPEEQYYGWEWVRLDHDGEIIRREHSCVECWWPIVPEPPYGPCQGSYAWEFYKEYIADPISNYLNNTIDPNTDEYLRDQIRYIVLINGIPIKILSANECWPWTIPLNVSVDALLCLLKTDSNNNPDIITQYHNSVIANPYGYLSGFLDPTYIFNHRFNSNHYVNGDWTLSYLVSRIDGQSLEEIELMIDRYVQADKSGEGTWILDGDPAYYEHTEDITATKDKFIELGFNFEYDSGDFCIVSSENPVIGYTSQGLHTGDNNPQGPKLDSGYIHNQLQFEYLDGAIFSSFESFNYYSNYSIWGRDDHGLVAEFVTRRPQDNQAGTGGNGHSWEPWPNATVKNRFYFTPYAMGYSMVDAAYLGMPFLCWVNVVAGDPLTTIAWGKQILTENTTWQGTNLVTDTIFIPSARTLTISANSVINLKHHGYITGEVTNFIINDPVTFNIADWTRALFVANNNNHPKLEWGNHPTIPPTYGFNVYRKIDSGNWMLLASVLGNVYTDNNVLISPPGGGVGQVVYYRITAKINLLQESSSSNEVTVMASKIKRKESAINNSQTQYEYSLLQNYPNPFNPITKINYSIKLAGLVTLKVYDILGKEVASLVNEMKEPGSYLVTFSASNLPSGIYFYRISSDKYTETKKLIILK